MEVIHYLENLGILAILENLAILGVLENLVVLGVLGILGILVVLADLEILFHHLCHLHHLLGLDILVDRHFLVFLLLVV
jgi:hypothetical protein